MSIKTRLIIIVAATILVVLAGQSFLVYFQSKEITEGMAFDAAIEGAKLNANHIEAWIRGKGEQLALLSKTDVIKNMDWAEQLPLLQEIAAEQEDLEALFISDRNGQARDSTDQPISVADRSYFQTAISTGKIAYSQPMISRITGATTVMIAQPIFAQDRVVGVLGATLLLDYLQELVKEMNISGYGHGWLLGENGMTLAHPESKYVGNQDVFKGNTVLRELADEMMQGRAGIGFYAFNGEDKALAYAPISVTNWSLAMTANTADILAPVYRMRNYSIVITLLAIAIGVGVAYLVAVFIANPLIKLRDLCQHVAKGDLTVEADVSGGGEINQLAEAVNTMVASLKTLIGSIIDASEHLHGASQQLNANCEESAAGAEETASTMNEIAATVQQIVSDIQIIADGSNDTSRHAEAGNKGVTEVTGQMATIAESALKVSESIKDLHDQTREIGQIIALINNFAEQTNLLALNATIEAARAGEYGRGFAVVADEVRNLAEQSAQATANIQELVNRIRNEAEDVVQLMELSGEEVSKGTNIVEVVGQSFLEIVQGVQKLNEQFEQMSAAAEQMAAGIQEVTATTQEQTASSEEVAAATESLSQLAQNLADLVGEFKI